MYNYAYQRSHEYNPTNASDSKLFFFVAANTSRTVEMTLRILNPDYDQDPIEMKYKLKELNVSPIPNNAETQLLRVSVDDMLT